MSITFKIANLDRDTADGFVTTAHWTASKTEVSGSVEFSGGSYGTAGFTKSSDMNLIPFETITEDMVIDWVKSSLGEEAIKAMEASFDAQIEEQKNPKKLSGTPWGDK